MSTPTTPSEPTGRVLVWDLPVRVFHWLLAISFAGAWLTSESERWHLAHITFGYTMAGLVAFRLVWGLVGTRHARFASFVRAPAAAWRYLKSLFTPTPEHPLGHNPAGALAIVGLLGLIALTTATGWANEADLAGDWLEEVHELSANALMLLVLVHLVGVVVGSLMHRENLVRSMITGMKRGPAAQGITRSWRWLGVLVLLAVLGFWGLQWQTAPAPDTLADASSVSRSGRDHDDDD